MGRRKSLVPKRMLSIVVEDELKQRFVARCHRYQIGSPGQILRALLLEWAEDLRWARPEGQERWLQHIQSEISRRSRAEVLGDGRRLVRLPMLWNARDYERLSQRVQSRKIISATARHLMRGFLSGAIELSETRLAKETAWGRK